jgi:hypothetical protein
MFKSFSSAYKQTPFCEPDITDLLRVMLWGETYSGRPWGPARVCFSHRQVHLPAHPSSARTVTVTLSQVRRRPPPALRAPADSGWAAIGRDARLLARRWFASPSFQSARPGRSTRVHPPLTCSLSIFPPTNVTSSLRPAHWHRVRPSAARPSACPSICRRSPARPLPG